MADVELIYRRLSDPSQVAPGTWNQIVTFRYGHVLAQTVEQMRRDANASQVWWGRIRRLTAALVLIGAMAFFPFGEAAAPALLAVLSASATTGAVLAIMTLLHDVMEAVIAKGQMERDTRDQLFKLAQYDPDAFMELGALLSRYASLKEALTSGAIKTLIVLAVSHKLKAVAEAMNFADFYQDVEVLFGPGESGG
jgi:hypothetical protein